MRIEQGVTRGVQVTIRVNGVAIRGFEGETVATALLAQNIGIFRRDGRAHPRGLFCNMGTCCECMVTLTNDNRRVRACVTDVRDGMDIATDV